MPSGAMQSPIELLQRGANPRYRDAYDRSYKAAIEKLAKVAELGIPSDKAIELLPYMLAMPHARAWRDGEPIPEGAARSESFTIVNRPYGIRLAVREADAKTFDQVNYLLTSIAQSGESIGWIPERVFFQILLAGTDADLLPAVPNAADGAALYATTAGGANRFAVANGNLYGGSGAGSAAAVISDLFGAVGRAKQFQDGQGQPLLSQDVFNAPITVIYGAHLELVMNQVMAQKFVFQDAGGNRAAAPTNLVLDAAYKWEPWSTQRIAAGTDDLFLFLQGVRHKAIAQTAATPVRSIFKTPENSDWCATWRALLFQWDLIQGFGVGPAFGTLKIDN